MGYQQPRKVGGGVTEVAIQNSTYTYAADAEASDAYAIALDPAVTAYAAGQTFRFKANTANTGGASLNVNGLGAKTILKQNNVALATGDIEAGQIVTVTYDGTNFQLQSADANLNLDEVADGSTYVRSQVEYTSAEKTKLGNQSGTNTGDEPSASTSAEGVVELAIASEVDTGTDATRAITPDALAGANIGIRYVQAVVFDFATSAATGDGKFYFTIPAALNGMNLVSVHARVITAGTTGTMDIQFHNVTDAVDMLSTKLTIDSAETGSETAATPAVINASNDDVATNDLIRVDVDAVQTTPAQGLIVTLGFQLP